AMPADRPSFVDLLSDAGYRTHGIGKCHFTPDGLALRGFQSREYQEEIVAAPEQDDYLTYLHANGFAHICDPHGIRGEMYYVPQPAQMPAALHPTQWIGDRTVDFLQAQTSSQPWMLFTSFIHPHPPFAPPNPWHKLYRAPQMPLPNVPQDAAALHTYINKMQNRYKYRDQGIDLNLVRCLKAYYYAVISFIDYQVGRILDTLTQTGQLENTLIIFTSDHGEMLGDYNCFGKRSMHNSCARVPLLVRHPQIDDIGVQCAAPASLVDVAPTILSACGIPLERDRWDGEDLRQVAGGSCQREHVFIQHDRGSRGLYTVVGAQWKYSYSAPDNQEYLFDRIRDPQETRNCADTAFTSAAQRRMKDILINFLHEGGEEQALDGHDWRHYPTLTVPRNPDAGLFTQDHPWADQTIPGYTDEKDPATI
ncbi:MAG TPA: sulfatase-like hydrolase/transferase, partial [Armatimonadota bacterium]|nr:sulfatase-like hydrolase/transferase [Armatimonadota bacterium]